MAAIHDLLAQVQDQALRERIEKEIEKMSKTKKFGLVFEEHLPDEVNPRFSEWLTSHEEYTDILKSISLQ